MKVCFLILHYNEIELTKKAVESIVKMSGEREIVIVDNCSPNGTGEELVKLYDNNDSDVNIHVLLNKENGGFAKGNNVGYTFIKNNIPTDFVVALNNDIQFVQTDFVEELERIYTGCEKKFFLAGPDVYTPHIRSHISPIAVKVRDKEAIEAIIKVNNDRIGQSKKVASLSTFFRYIQEKYQNSTVLRAYNSLRRKEYSAAVHYSTVAYDCVLNGACLIFDRQYIEKYDQLFEEATFLYGEEDFLTYRLVCNNEGIRYCPELKTLHVGEGSAGYTTMNYSQYCDKIARTSKVVNEALQVYIDYIEEK